MSQKTLLNAFLVIAAIAAISGALALLLRNDSNPGIEIVLPTPTPTPELKVHISGAVRSPGVYTFQDGDRLQDVVNAAGGLLPEADPSAVNLAERMRDEGQFHIPKVGETPAITPSTDSAPEDLLIDINIASVPLLQTLPGIGEVRAAAIVEYRETRGPFRTTLDIMKVSGIGSGVYEDIRDLIRVTQSSP